MKNKMNWLALSGFMIGPILGSGIILLPPMVYNKIDDASIYGWVIILFLGVLFALLFARLATDYPGEGGMTISVEKAFGIRGKLTSSFALISAVLFGPAAVLLTAAEYLNQLPVLIGLPLEVTGVALLGLMYVILMNRVDIVSRIILAVSSVITVILLVSSLNILFTQEIIIGSPAAIMTVPFGQSLLLLFWAIIGWEIIGNYSGEVIDTKKTIRKATIFSLVIITMTYLLVGLAVQSLHMKHITMNDLLYPLFGSSGKWLLAFLVTGLCLSTVITIVGAVGRLIYSMAQEKHLPVFFAGKNKNNIPSYAIRSLILIHLMVMVLSYFQILDVELLVSIANGFFILNAIMGLAASFQLLKGAFIKINAVILIVAFVMLLLFLEPLSYIGFIALIFIVKRGMDKAVT